MEEKTVPLVSVVIPFYNNGLQILETLESVFSQTYPRIEVIIVDDCSDEFPMIKIVDYSNAHRGENIERLIIHSNPYNLGTVKNLEVAHELCTGDIITHIAADDVFYSDSVFERYLKHFQSLPEDAEYLSGQVEMWDDGLKTKYQNFVTDDDIFLINHSTPKQLFNEFSVKCIIPAQGFWKHSYFEKIGKLSEHYRLIEDHTGVTRACRLGIKIYFLDYPIIKHRDGGISHGHKHHSLNFYKIFVQDEINYYENELQPYVELLSKENADEAFWTYIARVDYLEKLNNQSIAKESKVSKFFKNKTKDIAESNIILWTNRNKLVLSVFEVLLCFLLIVTIQNSYGLEFSLILAVLIGIISVAILYSNEPREDEMKLVLTLAFAGSLLSLSTYLGFMLCLPVIILAATLTNLSVIFLNIMRKQ